MTDRDPSINITPEKPRFDESCSITLEGFRPGREVVLTSRQRIGNGIWTAEATFRTDKNGRVAIGNSAPISGTYDSEDPMAIFWSMEKQSTVNSPRPYIEDRSVVRAELCASVDSKIVASRTVERQLISEDVVHESLRTNGLVGELYVPKDETPSPAVVLLGGSEGGLPNRHTATLLASEGYAVLALAYFGRGELPPSLEQVPFEYFERAIDWIHDHERIRRGPIGAVGWSRGAELALLLGTHFERIKTVIAYSPTNVVFQSGNFSGEPTSPWTIDGRSVPFVPIRYPIRLHAVRRRLQRKPFDLRPVFSRSYAVASEETIQEAMIPVEKIGGPILLISGKDDQMWPAERFGERIVERLDSRNYKYPYSHEVYENAGHDIRVPYQVTSNREAGGDPTFNDAFAFGGTSVGYARADIDSWSRTLQFLSDGLCDS